MDTANAHNDTIDETADLLEQESATDDETSELLEREPATNDEASEQPAKASSTPPANGWIQRLSTPAAGWVATAIATLVAALIRLPGLGNVRTLIFDETYYVKDAWSLLASDMRERGRRMSTPRSPMETPPACPRWAAIPFIRRRASG